MDLPAGPSDAEPVKKAAGLPVLVSSATGSSAFERVFLGAGTHDEDWLQRLIFDHPEILPISQIEPGFGTIIPAAREVACGNGFIDNLYLTPTGEIVLVETKLWRNLQARREVVAQALDYVSALMAMGFEACGAAVAKAAGSGQGSLYSLVADQPDVLEEAGFVDAVSNNLARGRDTGNRPGRRHPPGGRGPSRTATEPCRRALHLRTGRARRSGGRPDPTTS